MPRAKNTSTETKPYSRPPLNGSSSSECPSHDAGGDKPMELTERRRVRNTNITAPNNTTQSNGSGTGKWNAEEYVTLFMHVCTWGGSSKHFEGAVPGRTKAQAYDCFRQVIKPYLLKSVAEKAATSKWSAEEYRALLNHVFQCGASSSTFGTAVPGRTKNQSYDAFRQVLKPFIFTKLEEKASANK